MKMVLASTNKHKLEEIVKITDNFDIQLITLDEVGLGDVEIEENGSTFEENAMIKALEICLRTGLPTIADDSGLSVDPLNGEPGVMSARYSGEDKNYDSNNKKLLSELGDLAYEERTARFVTVLALCFPDGRKLTVRGEIEGKIAFSERGTNGFGYDPLFIPEGYDKTFAELTSDEKNTISHRARALARLNEELKSGNILSL